MADYKVIAKPRNSLAKDSWEFAVQTLRLLKTGYEYKSISAAQFDNTLEEAEKYRIFERLPDPKHPYGDLDAMLQAELGATKNEAIQIKLRKQGRPKKEEKVSMTPFTRGYNNAEYLTARIARDRPDILEEMKAGKYRSVRAAAIDAGIVKVPTSLENAQKAFSKLSKTERRTFIKWIDQQT